MKVWVVFLVVVLGLWSGCARPLDSTLVSNARDTISPTLVITSPAEYSSYGRTLVIQGKASDLSVAGAQGRVASLTYEILSHTPARPVVVASNGTFTITVPNDLVENIVVLLRVTDWNNNAAEVRLPLTYAGNDIPSFTATEGNRQTQLSWSSVPGVASYALYYETSAKTPDPTTSPSVPGVTSPYTLTQLKNASLYSFLLVGTSAEGKKNYSSVIRSIPLSTLNLFPRITPSYTGIGLEWRTYPAIASYQVERATSPSGPWSNVSGPVPGPTFFDTGVVRGLTYYYSVKPTANSSIRSEWAEARADSVAATADTAVGTYDGVLISQRSVWKNNTLFVADFWYGLRIIDVTTPEVPRSLADVSISGATGLTIVGNYAYVTGYKALTIVDISNPAVPVVKSTTALMPAGNTTLQATGIAVANNMAIIGGFNEGFLVVDVTSPTAPVVRLSNQDYAGLSQNQNVAVRTWGADLLVAVTGISKTGLYKLSGTAAAPSLTSVSSAVPSSSDATFSGTVLVLSKNAGLSTYETSTPASPVALGSATPSGNYAAQLVSVSGTRAYLALAGYGFAVIDLSNPASPQVVRVRSVPGAVHHVSSGGGFLYVSTGQGYPMAIYGAKDPSAAVLVTTLTNVNAGARLAAYQDALYVSEYRNVSGTTDWHGAVYSVATPGSTFRSTDDADVYTPYDFVFAGAKVVGASEREGLAVADASSPLTPHRQSPWYQSMPNGNAWTVALTGHYALIGTSASWVDVVDLSRPGVWSLVGSVQTQGTNSATTEVRRLATLGQWVFAANETAGVRVVDLTIPEAPQMAAGYGALPPGGSAAALATLGHYLYVADSSNGLLVYDATDPASWSGGGQARIWPPSVSGGAAYDLAIRGNYAYVAKGSGGLAIYDLSAPRTPTLLSTLTAAGFSPVALTLYKDYLYALDGASKLYVVNLVP